MLAWYMVCSLALLATLLLTCAECGIIHQKKQRPVPIVYKGERSHKKKCNDHNRPSRLAKDLVQAPAPNSTNLAVNADMYFFGKYVECPQGRELVCRRRCTRLTCADAGVWNEWYCPPLPNNCLDKLGCGCANSRGYFRESDKRERCLHKSDPKCNADVKYLWTDLVKVNLTKETPVTESWVWTGTDSTGAGVYVMRTKTTKDGEGTYPGKYVLNGDGYGFNGEVIKDNMQILCDPKKSLEWVHYKTSDKVIPVKAIKAGFSPNGVPQYIGKFLLYNDLNLGVPGRVEFGVLYMSYDGEERTANDFYILCNI